MGENEPYCTFTAQNPDDWYVNTFNMVHISCPATKSYKKRVGLKKYKSLKRRVPRISSHYDGKADLNEVGENLTSSGAGNSISQKKIETGEYQIRF